MSQKITKKGSGRGARQLRRGICPHPPIVEKETTGAPVFHSGRGPRGRWDGMREAVRIVRPQPTGLAPKRWGPGARSLSDGGAVWAAGGGMGQTAPPFQPSTDANTTTITIPGYTPFYSGEGWDESYLAFHSRRALACSLSQGK